MTNLPESVAYPSESYLSSEDSDSETFEDEFDDRFDDREDNNIRSSGFQRPSLRCPGRSESNGKRLGLGLLVWMFVLFAGSIVVIPMVGMMKKKGDGTVRHTPPVRPKPQVKSTRGGTQQVKSTRGGAPHKVGAPKAKPQPVKMSTKGLLDGQYGFANGYLQTLFPPRQRIPNGGGGDCFFRSLSQWKHDGDQTKHLAIRQEIVQQMKSPLTADELRTNGVQNVKSYLKKLQQQGTWADGFVAKYAAEVLRKNIIIYDFKDGAFRTKHTFPDESQQQYRETIELVNYADQHYELVTLSS